MRKRTAAVRMLKLDAIEVEADIQPRAGGCDSATVAEYAEAINAGNEFPPLVVFKDDTGTLRLSEGFHRHGAYVRAGRKEAQCEVREGTRADALMNAVGSNSAHGRQRTNADKQRAVGLLLKEFPNLSNREIAKRTKVSHTFVNRLRPDPRPRGNVSTPRDELAEEKAELAAHRLPVSVITQPTDDRHEREDESVDDAGSESAGQDIAAVPTPAPRVPTEREELAVEVERLRERVEQFAATPAGLPLLAACLVKDLTSMFGDALRAAKPDRGYLGADDRRIAEDVRHAETLSPSDGVRIVRCEYLHKLADVLRGVQ